MESLSALDLELYKNQNRIENCKTGLFIHMYGKDLEKLLKENLGLQEKLRNIGPEVRGFLERSQKFLDDIECKP